MEARCAAMTTSAATWRRCWSTTTASDSDVRVIGAHQLTPEMAEDVAASEFVLFLDAAAGAPAGKIQQKAIKPQPGPLNFAHHLDPALLLAAAMDLYGSVPPAVLLTIVGAAFELGDGLSPAVVQRLPELFRASSCHRGVSPPPGSQGTVAVSEIAAKGHAK